ncbi:phosphotransferase family enzyme [Kribbella amoyensis]|uniref:Phosphotransferase family enzyme n=1 Tax=Kribbella amoyensis TaxID=996641 RepID=A0A561BJN2_9ACTN|nr:aminoglycoside phosphotransferase family protein [Kribbella amoyensis]TWD79088.1 phosphotransferase family enzyme [Kribbella amoyensis]
MTASTERAARADHAVRTAAAAAKELGLTVTDPTVLYDVFSVVVHLKPSPVVARIPAVLPGSSLAPALAVKRLQKELDLARWLADQGHLVVTPTPLVPLRPVQRDGLSMTFWTYVEHDKSAAPDYDHGTALSAELHAVLAGYQGELPWMPALDSVPEVLRDLPRDTALLEPADYDRIEKEWATLEPVVMSRAGFEQRFPAARVQPIHGDAPAYNVIPTADGVLWSDFEDAGLGPVEWDLAGFGPELAAKYDEAAARLGRPGHDQQILQVMDTARTLQFMACLPLVPQLPELAEGLKMTIDAWRDTPFAGGL